MRPFSPPSHHYHLLPGKDPLAPWSSSSTVAFPRQRISPEEAALINALGFQPSALIKAGGGTGESEHSQALWGRAGKQSCFSKKSLLQSKRRHCQNKSEPGRQRRRKAAGCQNSSWDGAGVGPARNGDDGIAVRLEQLLGED